MYGSSTPPQIDMTKIPTVNPGVPIAFFVGAEDSLADPTDAKEAYDDVGTAASTWMGGVTPIPKEISKE